jgi:hypothetical protein
VPDLPDDSFSDDLLGLPSDILDSSGIDFPDLLEHDSLAAAALGGAAAVGWALGRFVASDRRRRRKLASESTRAVFIQRPGKKISGPVSAEELEGTPDFDEIARFAKDQVAERFSLQVADLALQQSRWVESKSAWGFHFTDGVNRSYIAWLQVFGRYLRVVQISEKPGTAT